MVANTVQQTVGISQYQASETHSGFVPHQRSPLKTPVIFSHGATGTGLSAALITICEDVTKQTGSLCIGGDMGGPSTYANSLAMTAVGNMKTWISGTSLLPAKTGKVILMGGSMGVQVNCAYALANPTHVAALICIIGLPSIQYAIDNDINNARSNVYTAYGGNGASSTGWDAEKATKDIGVYAESLAATNIPMLWVYSSSTPDTGLKDPFYDNAMVAALAARMPNMTTASQGQAGHTFGGIDATLTDQICAFVVANQQ